MKVSFAFEDLIDNQLSAGWSANQLNYSSGYGITVRFPTLRSINAYYADPNNGDVGLRSKQFLLISQMQITHMNY